ncbi:DinB superfamily protein [compost metagenome]
MLQRPHWNEFDPYFTNYVNYVGDQDILQFLRDQQQRLVHFFSTLTEQQAEMSYAPGKWSLKEVLGHINDSERVMSYWMLSVARGDHVELLGYDQDRYVSSCDFNECAVAELIADFQAARRATVSLLGTISQAAWRRSGIVVNKQVTAPTQLYIIAGHTEHHMNAIKHCGQQEPQIK